MASVISPQLKRLLAFVRPYKISLIIGIVFLRATLHADGTVSDIEIVMPVDYMTQSAIDSLMRSRFSPATVNGKPITLRKVPIKITVHY